MLGRTGEFVRERHLRALAFGITILGLIWVLTGWILESRSEALVMSALGFAFVLIIVSVLNNWRTGFYLFLFWLLFEDLARKYLGNNMVIYFAKDAVVGVTYLAFYSAYRRGQVETFRPQFKLPLVLFFWLAVVQVFNPSSPGLMYGLLGMKVYFYYIPLMFVSYALIRTEKDLHRLLVFNLGLAGLIALLGIIQSIVGPTFLNPSVLAPELRPLGLLTRISPITMESVYRPTSVFVSDGRFAWFLIMMWIVGLGAAGYLLLRARQGRRIVFLGIALVTTAIVMCGVRAAVVYMAASWFVMAAAFLWGAPWKWGKGHRLFKALRNAFLLAGLGLFLTVWLFPAAVGARWAFYAETLSPLSPESELASRSWDYPIKNIALAFEHPLWPYGYGTGVASLGVQYVARFFGEPPPNLGVENGFGTLVVEMGIIGLGLWLAWTIALVVSVWRVVRGLKGSAFFPIGFAVLWYAFLLLFPFTYFSMSSYQNYVLNAYLWILMGVLFRLPRLLNEAPVAVRPEVARSFALSQQAI